MSTNFGRAPAVFTAEIDKSTTVSSISTTSGGIAGVFNWGPVEQRVLVNNESNLVSIFGRPSQFNVETWFSAANFLNYSDALYVTRAANTSGLSNNVTNTVTNAVGSATDVSNTVLLSSIVKNTDAYDNVTFDASVPFVAKWPGALGNSIKVSYCGAEEAFGSNVDIVQPNIDDTSNITFTPGSNEAVLTVIPGLSGNTNTAISVANTITNALLVGDVLKVGDSQQGTQFVSLENIGSQTVIGNNVIVTLTLSAPISLFDPVSSNTITRSWEYANLVDGAPGTSLYQASTTNPNVIDELHVVVTDELGLFTGIPGSILEVFGGVSRATNAKLDTGVTNYFKNVINQRSQYVWVGADQANLDVGTAEELSNITQAKPVSYQFRQGSNGQDENNVPVSNLARAWDFYASRDEVDIAYLIQGKARGGTNGTTLANYLISLAEQRGDVIAVLSPELSDVVNAQNNEEANLLEFRSGLTSTSYGVLDCNYKYQYDKFNDAYRWVPLCGDIAGLMARSSSTYAPWTSPGGYSRGRIRNTIKLAWAPTQAHRDALYKKDINPVYNVADQGPVLMGDKTLLGKNSSFSRINVRQLFILLRKNIAAAAADLLFEINDEFTQAQFRNMNDPLLRDIQGRRGITKYLIVCDETNNTPQVVDNNGFAGDIYVSAARSINTIQLNFISTRTGIEFSEIEGSF